MFERIDQEATRRLAGRETQNTTNSCYHWVKVPRQCRATGPEKNNKRSVHECGPDLLRRGADKNVRDRVAYH